MFVFIKLSNIIRIRVTVKISFKMPKQERHTDKGSPPIIVYLFLQFFLACYFPLLPCAILYMTNTSEIAFLIALSASIFLIYLNSSLNPLFYCWRYREIRQIVKKTVQKIIRMNENMTQGKTLISRQFQSIFTQFCYK